MSGGYLSGGYLSGGYLSGGICPRIDLYTGKYGNNIFIATKTATAIIGANFLSYYKLAIDVSAKRELKSEILLEMPCKH